MNSLKVKKGLSATSKISTEFLEKITYQQQEKAPSSKVIDSVLLKNVNSKQVIAIRNAIELASKSTPNSLHSSPSTTRKLVKKQSTNSLHEASLLKHVDELKFETKKLDKKETGMKIDLKDLDTSMHSLTNLNQHKKGEANDFPSSQLNNINFEVEAMDLLLYQNSSINSNSDVIHDCNNVDNPLNDTDNANLQASIITSPVTTSAFKNHAALSTSPLLDSAFNHTVLGTSETSHAVNAMQLLNEANMLSNHYDADVLESKNIGNFCYKRQRNFKCNILDKDDAAKELLISENLAVTQKYDEGYKESEDFLLETENIKEIKNCMDSYASTDVDVLLKKKKSKNRSQPVLFSIETASWGIFGKLFNKENSYNYRANFTGHPSLEENLTLSSSVDSATLKTSLVSTQKSTSSIHLVDESVLSPTIPTNEDRKSFTATEIVRKSQIGENQENKPGHLIPMTGFYLSEVKSETTISTLKNKSIRILAPLHNGRNKPAIKQNGNPSNSETFLWLQEDISTLKIHKLIESDYKFYVKIMDSLNEVSIKELSYLMEALKCWSASRVISHFKKKKEKSKMKTLLNKMSSNADLKEDTEQSLAASVPNLVSFGEISVYIKENVTSSTTSNNTEIELEISHFLYQCINYIEKNGIESQGIFRVSGGFKRIEMLKDSLKQGEELSLAICTQPHDVATLMKGDLKEPLLTVRLYKPFIKTAYIKDHASKLKLIRILISLLPKSNLHHLYYLLKFLSKVTTYSSKNNMTSSNLAVCFGPNILRSEVTVQAQMHPPEPSDVGQLHHSDKLNYFKNLSPDLKRKSFLDSTGHLSKEKENNADSKINSIMQRKTSALDSGQSKKSIGEVSNIIETVTFLIDNFLELWKIPEFICVKVAAEIDKDKNE
ncbi:hypothetical protein HK099_003309 [Clydaea vesicula]|uniref:Rho-GAP domain-containing protein n=1 Tax=Clydaea vesicula TaxID=447962 RepID=A0AAD5U1Q9_9FUNG|nr:hypothetical protein HK099_003309 [Clydaea vesicula]